MYGKRFLAFLLSLLMLVGTIPAFALESGDVDQNVVLSDETLLSEEEEIKEIPAFLLEGMEAPLPELMASGGAAGGAGGSASSGGGSSSSTANMDSGTLPGGITWNVMYGMLSIGGEGAMKDFAPDEAPWAKWKDSIRFIYMADGITEIGSYAFYGIANATGVYFPDTLVSIGEGAFSQCASIKDILLPDSVQTIGESAFQFCHGLKRVQLPESLTVLEEGAFFGCSNLDGFTVAEGNENFLVEDNVLFSKNKETVIYYPATKTETVYSLPAEVKTVGAHAFAGAVNLTEITLPDGLEIIGQGAFSDCSALEVIQIPALVHTLEQSLFSGCSALKEINVAEENAHFYSDKGVLYNKSKTRLIQFPPQWNYKNRNYYWLEKEVEVIGQEAFANCATLSSLTIGSRVSVIEMGAFLNADSLQEIVFNGVEERWNQIEIGTLNEKLDQVKRTYLVPEEGDVNTFQAKVGQTYWLSEFVDINDERLNNIEDVVVTSSDTNIAIVDISEGIKNGRMVAISVGEAVISATFRENGIVTGISAKVAVSEGTGDSQSLAMNLYRGEVRDMKQSVTMDQELLARMKWHSTDELVAKVENGVVEAVNVGNATIFATLDNGGPLVSIILLLFCQDIVRWMTLSLKMVLSMIMRAPTPMCIFLSRWVVFP